MEGGWPAFHEWLPKGKNLHTFAAARVILWEYIPDVLSDLPPLSEEIPRLSGDDKAEGTRFAWGEAINRLIDGVSWWFCLKKNDATDRPPITEADVDRYENLKKSDE